MIVTGLQETPIEVADLVARIRTPACGAVVTFEGSTRSPDGGREILGLRYEAWTERAETQLRALAEEATARFGLGGVVAVHRTGEVPPGEPSVLVAAAAGHRPEAFEAARWLIDTLKETVSVWKKEISGDGEAWVGIDPKA